MDDLNTKATNLANHVQDIAQTYYELARINVAQAGSKALSRAIIFFLLAGLVLCILLLASIGLSLILGNLLNNAAAGYFIVASFYLVVVVLFYLLRKKIIFPFIRNFIVRKIYDKSDYQL
jgi:thiol:disulfide interchange protein